MLAGSLVVLVLARVYQRRWRYAGQRDYEAILRAVVLIVLLSVVGIEVARPVHRYPHGITVAVVLPIGVVVLFGLLCLLFLCGVRMLARGIYERRPLAAFSGGRKGERSVLIVGAGDGGRLVLREIVRNRELGLQPVGFLDDDPRKRGLRIEGVKVRGNTSDELPRVLDETEPDEVIIAIPSAPGSTRARVVRECRTAGHPGEDAADGVRAAADRQWLRNARAADARGARRGRARPRAGADGAGAGRAPIWRARRCS